MCVLLQTLLLLSCFIGICASASICDDIQAAVGHIPCIKPGFGGIGGVGGSAGGFGGINGQNIRK